MGGLRGSALSLTLILAVIVGYSVATETKIRAHVGTTVALPCRVDREQCGQLHSLKWYKDSNRVYVLSHAGQGRAEGDATERMDVKYDNNSYEALLKISPVEGDDEATYKCEITYLEVHDNCDVVQIVKLVTLQKPTSIRILYSNGTSITNGTLLGPKEEGDEVDLICEALGGKPIPKVTWYNGTKEIDRAQYTTLDDGNGFGRGTSKLQLTLSRGDLLSRFECKVESDALDEPIISWLQMDVHVRPTKIELSGVQKYVVQGTNVLLNCDVFGARPMATIRWANGSSLANESLVQTGVEDKFRINTDVKDERDGTYTTKSSLVFKASHWEDGRTFYCFAENEVISKNLEPELKASLILDVRHPPIITMSPVNTTVNETANTTVLLKCNYFANPQELTDIAWSKDGRNLTLSGNSKYVGGTPESPALLINNVTREDMGEYVCSLKNEVGAETSEEGIFLNVQYPPSVEVVMKPSTPIKAVEKSNVYLECNITTGNPSTLLKVRWFLDGEIMKEFPECNYTSYDENGVGEGNGGPFCGLDPSILSLERVDETFAGNYTCQGKNIDGWGPESEPKELIVYYPPSPAKLRSYPSKVVKGASVKLECSVDNPGRPDNVTYIWYRGSHRMSEVNATFEISPVRLETRSNFTCIAVNEGGESVPATIYINVNAPPAFIQKLAPYQGVLYNSEFINLTCIVECYPECSIVWSKNGSRIDASNNPLYRIETTVLPPNINKNDFESINSTLIWNVTALPGKKLNKTAPNSVYKCESMPNEIGAGVSSSIEIAVDYPPEDLTVTSRIVNVVEKNIPSNVKCHGKGVPALSYQWRNPRNEIISNNEELHFGPVNRSNTGSYVCEANNKHGTKNISVLLNVQYAPECTISTIKKNSRPALVCTVRANPVDVKFTWKVKESNETSIVTSEISQEGLKSYLFPDSSMEASRTYYCYANNTVGFSVPCEIDVAGTLPWWNQDKMIIIIASIIAIIIIVIIICVIIIILCRRKRADTKSPNQSSIEDKARLGAAPPLGGTADPLSDPDKGFYENLPFHGMQNPPNKPYRPDPCDLEYADVDYRSYGPINYKAASIYAAMKRNKNNNKMEEANKEDLL